MKKNKTEKSYIDRVHSWGRISSVTALCALIAFPLAICIHLNVWPEFRAVMQALKNFAVVFWLSSIVEVLLYTPMLGAGGTYLSFVTGNIPNLKLPCARRAMEIADVEANSDEGEIVSTISIATSSIVTTVVLAIGVLAFAPFLESFTNSPLLKPAFAQVTPALFGALLAGYLSKYWKITIFPIVVMVVILIFAPYLGASTLLFPGIVAAVIGAFVMWKLKWVK